MNKQFDWSKVKVREITPRFQKSKPAAVKPFAVLDLKETAKAVKALTTAAQLFVWIWIVHQTKKRNSKAVKVSNDALAPYGITRKVKIVALEHLEWAGLIAVEQCRRGKATVVKVLRCKF